MKYAAFGETKTIHGWAADVRCWVSHDELQKRIAAGWPLQSALVTPVALAGKVVKAFGESKTVAEWMADPRCALEPGKIIYAIRQGTPLESVLGPSRGLRVQDSRGEADASRKPRPNPKHSGPIKPVPTFPAFGEVKSLVEWEADPRCSCSAAKLATRLRHGIPLEEAVALGPERLNLSYGAFGERKQLVEWLGDPRRTVPAVLVVQRLATLEPMESAMTRPAEEGVRKRQYAGKIEPEAYPNLTLFGETKSLYAWHLDHRCQVGFLTLRSRVLSKRPRDESILLRLSPKELNENRYVAHSQTGELLGAYSTFQLAVEAIEQAGGVGAVEDLVHGDQTPIPRRSLSVQKNLRIVTA